MNMMSNLFSIFDPSTSIYFSLNWIIMIILLMLIPMNYWIFPSRFIILWMNFIIMIFNEFKLLINYKFISNLIIFISMMIMIMLFNMFGLMPYIFTVSSHLSMNLSLSLSLWISFMLYGWINNLNKMFIHLVPLNTPYLLMNFMVLIETISNIIRPWTLSIRLTANMLAGHLLLSLLGSSMNNLKIMLIILIFIQNILFLLEISVSMIQSYVFSILSMLYFNESN